ncbi:MAG: hypothetical protein V7642_6496 [Burkholderiales bacterium]|jgi:hypothetical protein
MSLSLFRDLAKNFCALTGLDDASNLVDGGSIELNGVEFSFSYNQNINPDSITIYCNFGPAPAEHRAEVYEALLEANMFVHVGHFPAFMVFQPTKHVLFATHRSLSITPEALCDLMIDVAEQAKGWTQHYFQRAGATSPHLRVRQ